MELNPILSFNEIAENLTQSNKIGFYMIHLEKAIDRIPLIQKLENKLNIKLSLFDALNGYRLVQEGHPTQGHQNPECIKTPGDVGCTVSHINICKEALEKKYDYVIIFEDDCEFISDLEKLNAAIQQFVEYNKTWDLFLLGCKPITSTYFDKLHIYNINQFNGTHACILSKLFMTQLLKKYEEYYLNSTTETIDIMYSDVIKDCRIKAYGFASDFFIQKTGIFSYVDERIK